MNTPVKHITPTKLRRLLREAESTQMFLEEEGISLKDLDDWIVSAQCELEPNKISEGAGR